MAKELQRKFIFAAMGSLLIVLTVLLVSINLINLDRVNNRLDDRLRLIAENGGQFPGGEFGGRTGDMTEETRYETRYFVVKNGQSPEEQSYYLDNITSVTNEDAREYLREVLESGRVFGYRDNYRFYVADTSHESYMVVFLYCRNDIQLLRSMLRITLLVGLIGFMAVLWLVILFSGRLIRPILRGMERQKQFITDASHEIKTPLGIISANNDVLAIEYGDSEWLDSTRCQTERLNSLVNGMVELLLNEERKLPPPEDFCVGDALLDVAADFETAARMAGKSFLVNVPPGVCVRGDEAALRQLLAILLDNAVRYSDEGAVIEVMLRRKRRRVLLEVSNPCEGLDMERLDRLFDRFYRGDASRSGKRGHGIGLSIAKGLAESRRWKLSVSEKSGGLIAFTLEL